ncbi:hypothetical protein L596_002756 [Steinernema carpocapsae]|uniref:Kinase n=1 Tax=Steinernema carpocapsae TaxID=34508 RepID=A0A4U8US08_STECR|nr:hypothetical protein L596_002756 [Steinernema carpocapsae]
MVHNDLECPAEDSRISQVSTSICDLRPLKDQVGGHASLLSLGSNCVCKPYMREAEFYKRLPAALLPFTAHYYCRISIMKGKNSLPIARFVDSPLTSQEDFLSCVLNPPEVTNLYRNVSTGFTNNANPWSVQCSVKESEKLKNEPEANFIVLENVTSEFDFPCILDLKLGTRQYGDEASPEKKQSQKTKCAKSTSLSLGVRICGLQYYDTRTGVFQCVDKYLGRSLERKGFVELLRQFFQDHKGNFRKSVCIDVVHKIESLFQVLKSQDGLRLFSSSLLIAYDAHQSCEKAPEVRLIDFAHATIPGFQADKAYEGPDDGCLLGLSTLSEVFTKFLQSAA